MTAPIKSHFDLFFVVLEECEEIADFNAAIFLNNVHKGLSPLASTDYDKGQLQRYIRVARKRDLQILPDARKLLVDSYKGLRLADYIGGARSSYRITLRHLESLISLSEALDRLHLDEFVRPQYVREAVRLLRKTTFHVETEMLISTLKEKMTMSASTKMATAVRTVMIMKMTMTDTASASMTILEAIPSEFKRITMTE